MEFFVSKWEWSITENLILYVNPYLFLFIITLYKSRQCIQWSDPIIFINIPSIYNKKYWITSNAKSRAQNPFFRSIHLPHMDLIGWCLLAIFGMQIGRYDSVRWCESFAVAIAHQNVLLYEMAGDEMHQEMKSRVKIKIFTFLDGFIWNHFQM